MLASPYHRITSSNAVRGIALWLAVCGFVFYMIDAIATRSVAFEVESFRSDNMTDEQVLSQALQAAFATERNAWWIRNKRPYLVFDTRRNYDISQRTYAALDLVLTHDAFSNPIAVIGPSVAGIRVP